jgi:hypothetical protein
LFLRPVLVTDVILVSGPLMINVQPEMTNLVSMCGTWELQARLVVYFSEIVKCYDQGENIAFVVWRYM